jgi:putative membrane protein
MWKGKQRVEAITSYVLHLLAASILIVVFIWLYTKATPFDEIELIKQGNSAAALSLGGALIGFSLTVASAILHTSTIYEFFAWSVGAAVVQVAVYMVTTRILHMSKDQVEANNVAFGGLLASISLAVGAINAACLS